MDYTLLKLIDRETINNLYNEKTLIFNDSLALIYSSIDDAVIKVGYWPAGKNTERKIYLQNRKRSI